jgi:hypothetical protein
MGARKNPAFPLANNERPLWGVGVGPEKLRNSNLDLFSSFLRGDCINEKIDADELHCGLPFVMGCMAD